jgi:tetratricopeptide (TPR) repeat protein
MARRHYGRDIGKLFVGIILLIVAVVGLAYGSLLRGMQQASDDYSRGDAEGAFKKYRSIEHALRSWAAIRVIPTRDRRNLFLNEARLLYAMGRYDDALDQMERENAISGITSDGRFLILRGDIAFRKAVNNYRDAKKKDPRVFEESLHASEDVFRDSLRLSPNNWDAKYNFEFINYLRNLMNQEEQGKIKILMENVRPQQMQPKALSPEQMM